MNQQLNESRCPNESCDAVLQDDLIFRKIDAKTGLRKVRAWCPHCKSAWQTGFELRGGIWVRTEDTTRIADAKELKSLQAMVSHVLGEVQVRRLSPAKEMKLAV